MGNQRLGRGLRYLRSEPEEVPGVGVVELNVESISPNRYQPRREFDSEGISGLSDSIRRHGFLQPVIVRRLGENRYELISGERRFRAAKEIGLATIPCVVRETRAERESLELALVENVQREDLNSIERARGYLVLTKEFALTQEEVAKRVGGDRSGVSNFIRLLELPQEIQESVSRGTISMGHARALLGLHTKETQIKVYNRIVSQRLSVRETEALVREKLDLLVAPSRRRKRASARPSWLLDLEERLQRRLSARVNISRGNSGRGRISVEFGSDAELERIVKTLLGEGR